MKPRLSIVLPCRDDIRLERALLSAQHPDAETVVILNGSTSDVRDIAVRLANRVEELETANLGSARARGVEAASADCVLFLDSDCWLLQGALPAVLTALEQSLVVRPTLCYASTSRRERLVAAVRNYTTVHTELPLLPLAIRKEVARKVGGYLFDKELVWGEDWELALRLEAADIPVEHLAQPLIAHAPLSIKADLASAIRLGRGRRGHVRKGLVADRSIIGDAFFRGEWRKWREVKARYGLAAAMYHAFGWRVAYKIGYHATRLRRGDS